MKKFLYEFLSSELYSPRKGILNKAHGRFKVRDVSEFGIVCMYIYIYPLAEISEYAELSAFERHVWQFKGCAVEGNTILKVL